MEALIKQYRSLTCLIILQLRRVNHYRKHLEQGYPNLFTYLIDGHKLSAVTARQLTNCLKLLEYTPQILIHIKNGEYNLASASSLYPLVTLVERKKIPTIVKICMGKSAREIENLTNNFLAPRSYKNEVIEREISQNLKRARNIYSTSLPEGFSDRFIINHCLEIAIKRKISKPISGIKSRYISSKTKKMIWERATHQCEYISKDGKRCSSKWALQIDHILPIAHGGTNQVKNLRLLCQQHNKYFAEIKLGKAFMHPYYSK